MHRLTTVSIVTLIVGCAPSPSTPAPEPGPTGPTAGSGSATGGTGTGTGSPGGTPSGTTAADSGTSTPRPTSCLEVETMTMEMGFYWDDALGQVTAPPAPGPGGVPLESTFQMNFGPPGWAGDTGGPGHPNNWCYVRWNLVGGVDTDGDLTSWLTLEGLDATDATTNCNQPTTPGAGDKVWLCPTGYGYGNDYAVEFSDPDWEFHVGPEALDQQIEDYIGYFTPYGYLEAEFFGVEIRHDTLFGPDPIEGLGFALDDLAVPTRHLAADIPQGTAAVTGYYTLDFPWIFTFQ